MTTQCTYETAIRTDKNPGVTARSSGRSHNIAMQAGHVPPDAGFTLMELLVVLGILALLATLAAPQVLKYLGKARTETARAQIGAISTAVELYSLDNGGFPPPQAGLSALVRRPSDAQAWNGPYLKRAEGLIDPWGRPYHYRVPGTQAAVEIFTLGRDNAPGGTGEDQDLTNW